MGRAKHLDSIEKARIDELISTGLSISHIAKAIKRDRKGIRNYLANKDLPHVERRGRKEILSEEDKQRILHVAGRPRISASKIIRELDIKASKTTILRFMRDQYEQSFVRKSLDILFPVHNDNSPDLVNHWQSSKDSLHETPRIGENERGDREQEHETVTNECDESTPSSPLFHHFTPAIYPAAESDNSQPQPPSFG